MGMEKPTLSVLATGARISKSYGSEILNGIREPSRSLAIHIFRCTGWKHSSIAGLTDEQITVLESVAPYQPRANESAAA